jgi:hypothetical protein
MRDEQTRFTYPAAMPQAHSVATQGRWTSLVGHALRVRLRRRIARLSDLDFWRRETTRIQRDQLRRLLSSASGTEIGRENGFVRLASLPDEELLPAYRKALPVCDWYAFKDRIARMREGGEPDVLWAGLVRDFAQTSGTTAGDKYIPVSREMMRSNYRASLDIFANMHRFGLPLDRVTAGKCLFLGGSSDVAENAHGIRTGDLSGLVTGLIRWPITEIYSPGPEIALMSHWPSKIDAMASACIDEDIRFISGMPSWAIVLFERVLQVARERGRAAACVRDLWPNLQVFVHGGVKYAPFDPRVRQFWSGSTSGADVPFRLELYPASEGFIAMQDTRGDPGLRLLSDIGNFIEFVPLEEIDARNPSAFACDEVEKGQKYVVVLSTCAGLWRYVLGDVVEFDSIPAGLDGRGGDGPARLRIVGRHKHFMNAFGENLIAEHIENAVAVASKETGLLVGEFSAAPIYPAAGQRGAVELAIEMAANEQPGAGQDASVLSRFASLFDRALKDQNVDYGTKRTDDLGMVGPTITVLPMGAFHRWMQSRGKLGGQHKVPRCANNRDILESVLNASGVRSVER